MSELTTIVTKQGLQKLLISGIADIDYIELGEGKYQPSQDNTKLEQPKLTIDNVLVEPQGPHNLIITARADESVFVAVSEIGIFFKDNTLFALWADKEPKFFKGEADRVRYVLNVVLYNLDIEMPTVIAAADFNPDDEDKEYELLIEQINVGIAHIESAKKKL